jgi:hypothetical protein
MKITKRDIKAFLMGVLCLFIIKTIYDWDGAVRDFVKGYNSARF